MTTKLYDQDAYRTGFSATVLSCEPADDWFHAVLDATAFFPEAGGQTPDKGTLYTVNGEYFAQVKVLDVQIDEETGVITHVINRPLPAGASVMGTIDWTHRYDNMQQHTGEHIFSGLVCRKYGCNNVGFHLSEQTVTMDYDRALRPEELAGIEQAANEVIWKNLPVEIFFPNERELKQIDYRSKKELTGQVRIVTIPGVDVCACCAPHVRRTGEVGSLKLVNAQNYKGGVRVTIVCGERALAQFKAEHDLLTGMARALSTSPEEVPEHLEKQKAELSESRRMVSQLSERILRQQLGVKDNMITDDIITLDAEQLLLFESAMDAGCARRVLDAWMKEHGGFCGIFLGSDTEGYRYLIGVGKCQAEADAILTDRNSSAGSRTDLRSAPVGAERTSTGRPAPLELRSGAILTEVITWFAV